MAKINNIKVSFPFSVYATAASAAAVLARDFAGFDEYAVKVRSDGRAVIVMLDEDGIEVACV